MRAKTLIPFSQFRVTLFFAPETGEFSGYLRMSIDGPADSERIVKVDPTADYNLVYEQLCEEWGEWLLMWTESARNGLPLL